MANAADSLEEGLTGEHLFRELLESAPDSMIIVNGGGKIALVNSQAEKLFGWARQDLIGQALEVLLPKRYQGGHVAHRDHYFGRPSVRPMGASLDLFGLRKDGTEFPVEVSLSPLKTDGGVYAISAIRDITDRKKTEERVRASLREKEVLLKEVHHRVKNNLQIISSIINLQSESIEDARAKQLFADTRARVRSIALVHERLYESKNLANIDFGDYVAGLVRDVFEAFGVDRDRISIEFHIEDVGLDLDKVINCGLIINELISNSLKYAFPNGRSGRITVALATAKRDAILTVSDDGVGIPPNRSADSAGTLGLVLVEGLTKELGGELVKSSEGGTHFKITFPR